MNVQNLEKLCSEWENLNSELKILKDKKLKVRIKIAGIINKSDTKEVDQWFSGFEKNYDKNLKK